MKRTTVTFIIVLLLAVFSGWQCSKSDKTETPTAYTTVTDGDVTLSEDVTPSGVPHDATAASVPDAVSPTK